MNRFYDALEERLEITEGNLEELQEDYRKLKLAFIAYVMQKESSYELDDDEALEFIKGLVKEIK